MDRDMTVIAAILLFIWTSVGAAIFFFNLSAWCAAPEISGVSPLVCELWSRLR